ncbi:MAG: DUF255 domain-containing protein [Pirellulaceae bacterium]
MTTLSRCRTRWAFPVGLCLAYWTMANLSGQEPTSKSVQHPYTNELIHSTSPYLLQHAHNPVNWLPWGPEAFAKAKRENKPIFVSVGYSTCYWCHVMERESFEDEEVAKILNERYVAIKVDREQRPDIDEQLMLATQLLTGRGGWPNSVWLTTDGRPWMGGTYFPKPQFMQALNKLADAWNEQAAAIDEQANNFAAAIRSATAIDHSSTVISSGTTPLQRAMQEAQHLFDTQHGGFGGKPKFPPHGMLRLLAFEASKNKSETARKMLTQTLDAMFCGGLHDHVGGGFHRYATDEHWFLPHFEKMLYDNAQLMRAYTEAYELTHNELYRGVVADISAWLDREMTHQRGGFYSAIDSESDGEEGRYYTWSLAELNAVLPARDAERFADVYNFEPQGNFAEEATGKRPGTNIPFLKLGFDPAAQQQLRTTASDASLAQMRDRLREARRNREYPHLDDKILASWNGLMIASLAHAGRIFDEPTYTQMATRAANFILNDMLHNDTLMRTWRTGTAELPGYLEDYAFMAEGLLELHQTTGDKRWLTEAQKLTHAMFTQFEDTQDGGFFFTGPKHEELIVRSKSLGGGGNMPVANGAAAIVLHQLHQRTQQQEYAKSLQRTLDGLSGIMHTQPRQVEMLVLADSLVSAANSESKEPIPNQSVAQHTSEALEVEMFVSPASVAPGQPLTVTVVIKIAKNFHLIANDPQKELIATQVTLRNTPGIVVGKTQMPAGDSRFDEIFQREISLFEGEQVFTLPATIAAETKLNQVTLEVELGYQACDDRRCLAPVNTVLQAEVPIDLIRRGSQ